MSDLGPADHAQLADRGIGVEDATSQLRRLRNPLRPFRLDRACRLGDGISRLSPERQETALSRYDRAAGEGRVTKFVPASGAATRMFRTLERLLDEEPFPTDSQLAQRAADGEPGATAWHRLKESWDRFPWAARWTGPTPVDHQPDEVLASLLRTPGAGFSTAPKGLIPFHATPDGPRTAFVEHLREGLHYLPDDEGRARYHFTVSPEHEPLFAAEAEAESRELTTTTDFRPEIGWSRQAPHTETLAVDEGGDPFREEDGTLLLRPGGHGALIDNLAGLDGDVVLIKNIDNVRPASAHEEAAYWQRVLAGHALALRDEVDRWLARLRNAPDPDPTEGARTFLREELDIDVPSTAPREDLVALLDRPLRVCGVVENTGEPGGGPFWVLHEDGRLDRQIVESAEVGDEEGQKRIFGSSTHFNPVLLACLTRDAAGESYDLSAFVDPEAVFVAPKSHRGRPLRALERPGLWNGAMSRWTTLFVEVPPSTFSPVKTVFDLLRPEHQPAPRDPAP